MTGQLLNYGFVEPQIADDHYVLGGARSLPKIVLQADGRWGKFLPTYEPQFGAGWDSEGCTVWGTENAAEILVKKIYGLEANFSERFIYNLIPVRPPGADPHTVAECIRDRGLIEEALLPMTKTFEEFCTPEPMDAQLLIRGQQWLLKNIFGHEWVFQGAVAKEQRIALMKEALRYSPLGVSVTAWFRGDDGIYRDNGQPNCHWCVCYDYDEAKQAWLIFDSYDQSVKLYSYESDIKFCKRYSLMPGTGKPTEKPSWIVRLLEFIFGFHE